MKVLITGGSGALGSFLVKSLSENNKILLISRKPQTLNQHNLNTYNHDLSNPVSLELKDTIKSFNPDAFIDIAAIQGEIGKSHEIKLDAVRESFEISFFSFYELLSIILPLFLKRGSGRVISFSGGGVTSPRPFFSPYACSKIAKYKLIENLAEENLETNITFNSIAPGIIKSNLLEESLKSKFISNVEKNKIKESFDLQDHILSKNLNLVKHLLNSNTQISGRLISAQWDDFEKLISNDQKSIGSFGRLQRIK